MSVRPSIASLLSAIIWLPGAALGAVVDGVIVDPQGKAIEFANVTAASLKQGTVTDEQGRFRLELPAGKITLEATQIGYEPGHVTLVIEDAAPSHVRLILDEQPVPLSEVQVTASSFGKTGKSEGAVVRRMDIYSTPGGTADVFQALRGLPGINSPNEGAALYVRGGDPRETLIRLDGGEIGHPYHYELRSGGLFGAFSAYMLKSAFFSSGGFSAKYGGALSGVLDIESADPMNTRTVSVGANLVGGELSTSWALVPDRLSLIGGYRRSAIDLLIDLYGGPAEYETVPNSQDGAAKLLWRYSPTGRLSLLYLDSFDRVGVRADYLNVQQSYHQDAGNRILGLQFKDVLAGRVALSGQVAGQLYRTRWRFGEFGGQNKEKNGQANVDAVWPVTSRHELSLGANWHDDGTEITGKAAADSTDFQPGAPERILATDLRVSNPGFYLEDKVRMRGKLYATLGGRIDFADHPGTWTADPRGALAYLFDEHQSLRLSTGVFHQLPAPEYLDPVYGNPQLEPLRARHVIAGYEWKTDQANVRVEAYRKDYRNLVTNDSSSYYANHGRGYARGVDVFVQGSLPRYSGWVSYGYMDSKRKEFEAEREVPSPYGVRHLVTVVGNHDLDSHWQAGFKLTYSTGRPYKPVVGRSYDASRDLWRPIYGEVNSAQLPDYCRMDVRLTRLFSLPAFAGVRASSVCAFYIEALNVLDRKNVLDYAYSSDYSQRFENLSYFSERYLVGGFFLTW